MPTQLAQWITAAALSLSPHRNHDPLAEAISSVLLAQEPLFKGDTTRQRSASLVLAVNFREGSLITDIKGDKNKKGVFTSFCSMQINIQPGNRTEEGWTGEELAENPVKCVIVGVRMLRQSMRMCPKHPVAFYAEGIDYRACASPRAQRISNDRMFIAQKLVKGVKWPEEEYASAESPLWAVPPRMHASRMFWEGGD